MNTTMEKIHEGECKKLDNKCRKPSIANRFPCKFCANNEQNYHHYYNLNKYFKFYQELVMIWCTDCKKRIHYHCIMIPLDQFAITKTFLTKDSMYFKNIFKLQKESCGTHESVHVTQKNVVEIHNNNIYSDIKISCSSCNRIFVDKNNGNILPTKPIPKITYRFTFYLIHNFQNGEIK